MSEITAPAWATRLRALTPARVALGRTGVSQQTQDLLDFQRAHALSRDAVHAQLDAATLAKALGQVTNQNVLHLHSMAASRAEYLQRPDLGRRLDEASLQLIAEGRSADGSDLAIIVADGLSALAVERHVPALLQECMPRLSGWEIAPICVVEQGRVAIGDQIGETLWARLVVVLIGERPGLSSPDSLGAYITWDPKSGRTDAERNCISNIRSEGLSYQQAASQLSFYLHEARRRKLTGVRLKDEAPLIGEG